MRYAFVLASQVAFAEFVDDFYNATGRHSHLGYVSPIEVELKHQVAAAAA